MAEMTCHVRVAAGGRIVIPANVRKAMDIRDGELVTLQLEDGRLSIMSRREAIRRVQEYVRSLPNFDSSGSMVDELIAERRAEALREDE